MTHSIVTRIVLVAGALAIAACSTPSEKSADVGATATTTSVPPNTANGADTGRAATDSANKAATSGNPTGSSSTRPTKP